MKSIDVKAENARKRDEIRAFQALSPKQQAAEYRRVAVGYPDGHHDKIEMLRQAEALEKQ